MMYQEAGSPAAPQIREPRAHVDEGRASRIDSPPQEDDSRRWRSSRWIGGGGSDYDLEGDRSDRGGPSFLYQRGGAGDDQKEGKVNTEERSIK